MKLLFIIAALFIAIEPAPAEEFLVLLGDENSPAYVTNINPPMTCLEALNRHLANQKNGTWLSWQFEGQQARQRIWNVYCIGVTKKCPGTQAETC
jgi:hypothetical protein